MRKIDPIEYTAQKIKYNNIFYDKRKKVFHNYMKILEKLTI